MANDQGRPRWHLALHTPQEAGAGIHGFSGRVQSHSEVDAVDVHRITAVREHRREEPAGRMAQAINGSDLNPARTATMNHAVAEEQWEETGGRLALHLIHQHDPLPQEFWRGGVWQI